MLAAAYHSVAIAAIIRARREHELDGIMSEQKFSYEELVLQHRTALEGFFRMLGELVFDFSKLDLNLSIAVRYLSGMNAGTDYHRQGIILVSEMSFKAKVHAIASLMRENIESGVFTEDDVKALTKCLFSAELARNNALHSEYYTVVDYGPDGALTLRNIKREKYTAKSSKGLDRKIVENAVNELRSSKEAIDNADVFLYELLKRYTGDEIWNV